jgi:hypothetical protein
MTAMTIRVATYNLYLGADLSLVFGAAAPRQLHARTAEVRRQLAATDFTSRARVIAWLLVRERVDLAGLQEVTVWTRTEQDGSETVVCDFASELTGALAALGEPYDVHAVATSFEGGSEEERLRVRGANAIVLRRSCGLVVEAERTGSFETALVVPTMVGAPTVSISRSWGLVDVRAGEQVLRLVNTHTEAYDETTRNRQRDELLRAVGEVDSPVVITGDFNCTPEQVGMPEEYDDAWLVSGGDVAGGLTCGQAADLHNPTSSLARRIDYIWVRGATVESCRTIGADPADRTEGGLWPSDHAGVVASLAL